MPVHDVPSLGDKVRYQLDRFLSWSPLARFLGLFALSFALVVVSAVLALAVMPAPEDPAQRFDLLEALWWAMTRVADSGTFSGDTGTGVRLVGVLATLAGVGVVALLIGLVSSTIGEKLDDLRKGKSPVIDSGHTLILGAGEKVFAILRELAQANANQRSATVAILSPEDKEAVETAVRERLGDLGPTRVVVRQGSPHSVHDLRKVGAGRAKSIIVLSGAAAGEVDERADLEVIKALLALRRIPGALTRNHAVVELADSARRSVVEQLGAGGVEVVAMGETLSRMMVQTARQNGLAAVYRDLLSYEGSELYFKGFPELAGQPFGVAQWRMQDGVVCGVRTVDAQGRAQCVLNPPDTLALGPQDELLVLAEDDDRFSLTATHAPEVPAGFRGGGAQERTPERLLVCGMSPRLGDILEEYDHYVLPGSEVWLMPGQSKDAFAEFIRTGVGPLANLKLKHVEGDPTLPEALARVVASDFAVAMVVADLTLPPEEADARTVITVLLLRDLFRRHEGQAPRIISEILDPRTKDLLEQGYGADFVVSSEMTSMLLAQVSERRELNAVFADLFDADGNEVYLKRAACYALHGVATPWLTIQKVARLRGEVALGVARAGQPPELNPRQTEALVLTAEDRVIVLAQDDSEAPLPAVEAEAFAAPEPTIPAGPAGTIPEKTQPRSPLLPPEPKLPEVKTVSAGPRVVGPSQQPRPPLPPKPRSP